MIGVSCKETRKEAGLQINHLLLHLTKKEKKKKFETEFKDKFFLQNLSQS